MKLINVYKTKFKFEDKWQLFNMCTVINHSELKM